MGMLSETKLLVFFSSYGEKRNGLKQNIYFWKNPSIDLKISITDKDLLFWENLTNWNKQIMIIYRLQGTDAIEPSFSLKGDENFHRKFIFG